MPSSSDLRESIDRARKTRRSIGSTKRATARLTGFNVVEVSLVDRAANNRTWAVVKAANGADVVTFKREDGTLDAIDPVTFSRMVIAVCGGRQ